MDFFLDLGGAVGSNHVGPGEDLCVIAGLAPVDAVTLEGLSGTTEGDHVDAIELVLLPVAHLCDVRLEAFFGFRIVPFDRVDLQDHEPAQKGRVPGRAVLLDEPRISRGLQTGEMFEIGRGGL